MSVMAPSIEPWSFDTNFKFGKNSSPVVNRPTEMPDRPRDTYRGSIKKGTPIEILDFGRTYVAICPSTSCGYQTYACYNKLGAQKTLEYHIKISHRIR